MQNPTKINIKKSHLMAYRNLRKSDYKMKDEEVIKIEAFASHSQVEPKLRSYRPMM
jgi:hypothetical protein